MADIVENCALSIFFVKEKLFSLLAEAQGLEISSIKMCSDLEKDLGVESLDRMEVGFRIEREFKIETDKVSYQSWQTVQDIYIYIYGSLSQRTKNNLCLM
jgi:acyl carrier protein